MPSNRISPAVIAALVLLAAALTMPNPAFSQQIVGANPDTLLILHEAAVILAIDEESGELEVAHTLPEQLRPEGYAAVNLKTGDGILMLNGERLRSLSDARRLYESIETGSEVKLGVARGEERFLIRFAKLDPAERPATRAGSAGGQEGAVRMRLSFEPGEYDEIEPVLGLGFIAGSRDGKVFVADVLQLPGGGGTESPLEPGDEIRSLGGKSLESIAQLAAAVEATATGEAITVTLGRDGETIEASLTKAPVRGRVMVRPGR